MIKFKKKKKKTSQEISRNHLLNWSEIGRHISKFLHRQEAHHEPDIPAGNSLKLQRGGVCRTKDEVSPTGLPRAGGCWVRVIINFTWLIKTSVLTRWGTERMCWLAWGYVDGKSTSRIRTLICVNPEESQSSSSHYHPTLPEENKLLPSQNNTRSLRSAPLWLKRSIENRKEQTLAYSLLLYILGTRMFFHIGGEGVYWRRNEEIC